jgi:hypothetical protein
VDSNCQLLVDYWNQRGHRGIEDNFEYDKGHSKLSRGAGALCESLQSFTELRWFNVDALSICTEFLKKNSAESRDFKKLSRTRCCEEFNIGRLEELISMYKPFVDNESQNPRARFGKRMFSKFLHGLSGLSGKAKQSTAGRGIQF